MKSSHDENLTEEDAKRLILNLAEIIPSPHFFQIQLELNH